MNPELIHKMNQPVSQILPSGLLDDSIEIFVQGNEVYALTGGRVYPFSEWNERILSTVEADMEKYPEAINCLIELGIEERLASIRQYARCKKGGFDKECDYTEAGDSEITEYWNCGFRGKCPYEGLLCSNIMVKNGVLSKREIQIIALLYEGMSEKQVAGELNIADGTVAVYKQRIFSKIGIHTNAEIVRFAAEKNIKRLPRVC